MPNRLINEASPYLRQHADDPVDWYPWGPEAFERAKREDKPILLSIGYAACHWCHVMERESFEDPETARIMNEHFINIKVDREERPDIDAIYMEAVQAMTGQGGWPLTVFLTPEGVPFYGGTYFPPTDRHGLPSFKRVLLAVAEAYRTRKDEIQDLVAQTRAYLQAHPAPATVDLGPALLDQALETLAQQFDPVSGGFGGAPKFPQATVLEFLLRSDHRTGRPAVRQMLTLTLDHMARGGLYARLYEQQFQRETRRARLAEPWGNGREPGPGDEAATAPAWTDDGDEADPTAQPPGPWRGGPWHGGMA